MDAVIRLSDGSVEQLLVSPYKVQQIPALVNFPVGGLEDPVLCAMVQFALMRLDIRIPHSDQIFNHIIINPGRVQLLTMLFGAFGRAASCIVCRGVLKLFAANDTHLVVLPRCSRARSAAVGLVAGV